MFPSKKIMNMVQIPPKNEGPPLRMFLTPSLIWYNNYFLPEIREFFIKNIFCSFIFRFNFFPGSHPGHVPHHAGHPGAPSHHVRRAVLHHLQHFISSIEIQFLQSGRENLTHILLVSRPTLFTTIEESKIQNISDWD